MKLMLMVMGIRMKMILMSVMFNRSLINKISYTALVKRMFTWRQINTFINQLLEADPYCI